MGISIEVLEGFVFLVQLEIYIANSLRPVFLVQQGEDLRGEIIFREVHASEECWVRREKPFLKKVVRRQLLCQD
eukprot:1261005-Rhodomonas_salina.1